MFKTVFGSKRSYDEYMFKNQELAAQRQHDRFCPVIRVIGKFLNNFKKNVLAFFSATMAL
jgi:hypothetical protein